MYNDTDPAACKALNATPGNRVAADCARKVAIMLERLEVERKGADGKTEKEYAAWVTRDDWRKVSNDKWLILYSEEVGQGTLESGISASRELVVAQGDEPR